MNITRNHMIRVVLAVMVALAMCMTALPFAAVPVYGAQTGEAELSAPEEAVTEAPAAAEEQEQAAAEEQQAEEMAPAAEELNEETEPAEEELTEETAPAAEEQAEQMQPAPASSEPAAEETAAADAEPADSAQQKVVAGSAEAGSALPAALPATQVEKVPAQAGTSEAKVTTAAAHVAAARTPLKVTAKAWSSTYNAKAHRITLNGVPGGASIKYSLDGKTWSNTAPTRTAVGTTKVQYRITAADGRTAVGTSSITIKPAALKKVTLSKTRYVCNGKVKKPSVTVYAGGKKLTKGKDYTVSMQKGRKKVGKYKITIKGKGNYQGTITKMIKINPAKASLSKMSLRCGTLKYKTRKSASSYGADRFQIAYKKPGGFWKLVTTKSSSKTLSVAEVNTYYVKVRAINKKGGATYKGSWSKTYKVNNQIPAKVRRVLRAANSTPYAGQGWCAAWVCNVFDNSGVVRAARMPCASDYYRHYCYSSDRNDLKPGMIVASRLSYAGGYAGHIGIYIGHGKIISNEVGITVRSVDSFAAAYSHGYPIRWGWMNGKKLF